MHRMARHRPPTAPEEPHASRLLAGHNQEQAAATLGVGWRAFQDWELGVRPMPFMLLKLYRHLAGIERIPFKKLSSKTSSPT